MIAAADEFILYDDMQYTRRDWRNRNQIKTPHGIQWLTVPVQVKGRYHQKIRETETEGNTWAQEHWKKLVLNYQKAPHFAEIAAWLEPVYLQTNESLLSDINRKFLEAICRYLQIETTIKNSWDYELVDGKTERLLSLCMQASATEYISGPAAKSYVDESLFTNQGITLTWFDYSGYPEYKQLWGDYTPGVTILDLLFNCGSEASRFMRYV